MVVFVELVGLVKGRMTISLAFVMNMIVEVGYKIVDFLPNSISSIFEAVQFVLCNIALVVCNVGMT